MQYKLLGSISTVVTCKYPEDRISFARRNIVKKLLLYTTYIKTIRSELNKRVTFVSVNRRTICNFSGVQTWIVRTISFSFIHFVIYPVTLKILAKLWRLFSRHFVFLDAQNFKYQGILRWWTVPNHLASTRTLEPLLFNEPLQIATFGDCLQNSSAINPAW